MVAQRTGGSGQNQPETGVLTVKNPSTAGGTPVYTVLQSAARRAGVINHEQDLSGIPVGWHDEIFQGSTPVLTGVCAVSTYCYLLVAAEHRDADTWCRWRPESA